MMKNRNESIISKIFYFPVRFLESLCKIVIFIIIDNLPRLANSTNKKVDRWNDLDFIEDNEDLEFDTDSIEEEDFWKENLPNG